MDNESPHVEPTIKPPQDDQGLAVDLNTVIVCYWPNNWMIPAHGHKKRCHNPAQGKKELSLRLVCKHGLSSTQ